MLKCITPRYFSCMEKTRKNVKKMLCFFFFGIDILIHYYVI